MARLKGEKIFFRRDWRAAMMGRGFLGRFGRSKWTGKTTKKVEA